MQPPEGTQDCHGQQDWLHPASPRGGTLPKAPAKASAGRLEFCFLQAPVQGAELERGKDPGQRPSVPCALTASVQQREAEGWVMGLLSTGSSRDRGGGVLLRACALGASLAPIGHLATAQWSGQGLCVCHSAQGCASLCLSVLC